MAACKDTVQPKDAQRFHIIKCRFKRLMAGQLWDLFDDHLAFLGLDEGQKGLLVLRFVGPSDLSGR